LYINSYGGDFDECISLCGLIKGMYTPVATICTGGAYSSAALILSSGKKGMRFMLENSRAMIHGIGCSFECDKTLTRREFTDILNKQLIPDDKAIFKLLSENTGKNIKFLKDYFNDLSKDTYLTPQKARKLGLIDKVVTWKEIDKLFAPIDYDLGYTE